MCAQIVPCYFCGEASQNDSTLKVPMFMIQKVQRVETAYKTSTVQYEKKIFTIPRCRACCRRHGLENALGTAIGAVGLLAVLGAVLLALSQGIGWGAGFLLLAVVILALAAALQERLLYGGKENLALKHRETWPQVQREYFRTLYLEITAQISAYYIEKHQITPAMILCQKVLARDRCNERAYRDLILCHLLQGQRQLAIREYQVCVQALKDDLGLPPSEEIQALYRQILAG